MLKYRSVLIAVLILAMLGAPMLEVAAEVLTAIFADSGINTLTPTYDGVVAWGDSDGDGDLDLLITGNTGANGPVTALYLNTGNGTFFQVPSGTTRLINVRSSAAAWGDVNHDGRLDLALSGETTGGALVTKLYRNDGNSTFTEIDASLIGVRAGALAWGDYNNDGALDLLMAGDTQSGPVTRLYRNNGDSTFSIVDVAWPNLSHGSIGWSDFNLDGRSDVLLVGPDVSRLYRNDGDGHFTEVAANLMTLDESAAAAWGDYNNDGRPDIALVGCSTACAAKLYRNDGNGSFTDLPDKDTGLTPVGAGAGVAWGDYDNDGLSDLLLNGNRDVSTRVFHNNGNDTFTPIDSGLPAVVNQAFAWGDFNNSSQLDVLINGNTLTGTLLSRIFSSTVGTTNSPPAPPTVLNAILAPHRVQMQWQAPLDDHTPPAGLTYQVRVGTTPGGSQIVSPQTLSSGYRQLPQVGSSLTTTAQVLNLEPGKYYWTVQAVDAAFAGSAFATENTFTILNYAYLPYVAFNAVTYFPGPNEVEPNNVLVQANGPLVSGQAYNGLHDDKWDVFSVYMLTAGTVHANLQTPRTGNMQLQVYYQNISDPSRQYVSVPPYQVNYTGAAGWYYIYIYNGGDFNSDNYTLTATYP